jgi:hypothetical protein
LPFSKFSLLTIFSVQSLPPFVSSFSSLSSVETTFSEWNDDDLFVLIPLNADLFFAALKAAVRVFFAAKRKELDFAAEARGKNFLPKMVVLVVEKARDEEEREEKEENPTHHPRGIKRSPFRSARKEDVERGIMIRCLLSLRGELEVTFCVTVFHVVDKDDVFSGDHPTQNGRERLLLQRSATQKEAVVETSGAIRSESGRG